MVIGASPNPERYSYKATALLVEHGIEVVALGIRKGKIGDEDIILDRPSFNDIHTVTLYVGPKHQEPWLDYLASLKPERIIFNPGTENPKARAYFATHRIFTEEACTLVLLQTKQY